MLEMHLDVQGRDHGADCSEYDSDGGGGGRVFPAPLLLTYSMIACVLTGLTETVVCSQMQVPLGRKHALYRTITRTFHWGLSTEIKKRPLG